MEAPAGLWPGLLAVMAPNSGTWLYVHRLLAVRVPKEGGLLTKGDAVFHMDIGLVPATLVGIVVKVQRNAYTLDLNTPVQRRLAWMVAQLSRTGAKCYAARRWRLAAMSHRGIALLDQLAWRLRRKT